jgi:hypothetical protein
LPVLQEVMERIPALVFSGFMRQPEELTLWPETNARFLSNLISDTWDEVGKRRTRNMAKHGTVSQSQTPSKQPHKAEARMASSLDLIKPATQLTDTKQIRDHVGDCRSKKLDKIRNMVRWHYDLAEGPGVSKMVEELLENDHFACVDYKADVRNLSLQVSFPSTAAC